MKTILITLTLLIINNANGAPIINDNAAINSGFITMYPDHKDPNHFYLAPNVVTIAQDEYGRPNFTFTEYKNNIFSAKRGIIQMTLLPAYRNEDFEQAKQIVLTKNPKAYFSALPFIRSELKLTGDIDPLIEDQQCNHVAGLVGQEQSCVIMLSPLGRKTFLNAVNQKKIFMTLQFKYEIEGFIEIDQGKYESQTVKFGVGAIIDGKLIAGHPELIKSIHFDQ